MLLLIVLCLVVYICMSFDITNKGKVCTARARCINEDGIAPTYKMGIN